LEEKDSAASIIELHRFVDIKRGGDTYKVQDKLAFAYRKPAPLRKKVQVPSQHSAMRSRTTCPLIETFDNTSF
jgi:hypothetical protein